jgi:uncharacterized protein with PQ loop repeat
MNGKSLARLNKLQRYLIYITIVFPALSVLIFVAAQWPQYWKWIATEDTPMTTLQVAVMYTIALVSWTISGLHHLRFNSAKSSRWLVLGCSFFWFALDDRFAIHERIRDSFLAPRHISIPFLPIAAGDFVLLFYMAVGLLTLKWLLPIFQESKTIRNRFLAGIAVAVLVITVDAYDIHRLDINAERLEQTVEEIFELIAQILFLQGAIIAWFKSIADGIKAQELTDAEKL